MEYVNPILLLAALAQGLVWVATLLVPEVAVGLGQSLIAHGKSLRVGRAARRAERLRVRQEFLESRTRTEQALNG